VIAASAILFGGQPLVAATSEVLEVLEGEVPVSSLALTDLSKGVPLVDALVTAGLASSKADAKRGVEQKGFSVNGAVAAPGRSLGEDDLLAGRYVVLQKGKKNYAMLVVT
jgi:tyrosyl-tRNA synthetase